jgi:hypothetical protein
VVSLAATGVGEPLLTLVKMSPEEARRLAQQLVEAAEHAEGSSETSELPGESEENG